MLVRAAGAVNVQRLADNLGAALRRTGHPQPAVSARVVDTLPRGAVGKLKRFVPLGAAE